VTFEEAVAVFRASGLIVEVGPGSSLTAVADPEEPPDELRSRGVSVVYLFGFSMHELDGIWFLRVQPPEPARQFAKLEDAVSRGQELLHEHRDRHSPREYCDQFARFEAVGPCTTIEAAFIAARWLTPSSELPQLGLYYVAGCEFRARFPEQRRVVIVSASPLEGRQWRLIVRCYRTARSQGNDDDAPYRGHDSRGVLIPDPLAPALSYTVASAVHHALVCVVSDLRWALHREPEPGNEHGAPVAPTPT
jgi:hypothetical protein